MMTCPVCGTTRVSPVREPRQVAADDGTVLTFDDELSRCEECRAEFYTHAQSLAASRARAAVLRAHEGLLTPQEIRVIREQLGYTQAQLEHALGTGPKTVVRWEKGTVRQSRMADQFLRALAGGRVTGGPTPEIVAMAGTMIVLDAKLGMAYNTTVTPTWSGPWPQAVTIQTLEGVMMPSEFSEAA